MLSLKLLQLKRSGVDLTQNFIACLPNLEFMLIYIQTLPGYLKFCRISKSSLILRFHKSDGFSNNSDNCDLIKLVSPERIATSKLFLLVTSLHN